MKSSADYFLTSSLVNSKGATVPAGAPRVLTLPRDNHFFPKPNCVSESVEDLADLAGKIKDLIDSIFSFVAAESTILSSLPALPTHTNRTSLDSDSNATASLSTPLPTEKPNATLACEIYHTYTSLCPPTTVTPYTNDDLPGLVPPHFVDSSEASVLADSTRASCLCYSSLYFVPYVYDNAAKVCATHTGDFFAPAASAASAAATLTEGFCSSIGNVRPLALAATFGQFAATTTPTTTSTSTSISTSTSTLSVAATGGISTSAAGRSYEGLKNGAWAVAAVAVLI